MTSNNKSRGNAKAAMPHVRKLIRRFGRTAVSGCFSKILLARMARGRLRKKQNNGSLGGVPPYGYRVVGLRRNARLKPVPREQLVIKNILFWRKKKLSSWNIMKKVNDKGYKNRFGAPFECYQIKRIIERAATL
jgi:hypothetical protein